MILFEYTFSYNNIGTCNRPSYGRRFVIPVISEQNLIQNLIVKVQVTAVDSNPNFSVRVNLGAATLVTQAVTPSRPFIEFRLQASPGTAYVIEADNNVVVSISYSYPNVAEIASHVVYPVEYIAFNYFVLTRQNRGNVLTVAATADNTRVCNELKFKELNRVFFKLTLTADSDLV